MRQECSAAVILGLIGSASSFVAAPAAIHVDAARIRSARSLAMVLSAEPVATKVKGEESTADYRVFFTKDGKDVSPWHDIPLEAGSGTFNFVCEIPKYSTAKMEVSTKEALNPIAQDIKKGKPRFYHGPIFWNYGCLPQTWEDPTVKHPELGCLGDGDPVDVVEIGSAKIKSGSCVAVKPLGCLAMIDDGELDWKVIAISTSDPLAAELNDIADVEKKCPGVVSGIREWFRWYKTPDDKPINAFGFDERALNKAETLKVIEECNGHWKALMGGKTEKGKMWTGK